MASDPPLPYYPGREDLWIGSGLAQTEVNERELVHPIAEGPRRTTRTRRATR